MKFSIRQMLVGMTGVGVICALLGGWASGSSIAYGLTIGIVGSAFAFLVFAALFWLTLPASYLFRRPAKVISPDRGFGEDANAASTGDES